MSGGVSGGEGPWQLASNLPYSVGTAILRRFMPHYDLFTRLVVMLQREVAVRVVAEPRRREPRTHGPRESRLGRWPDRL